MNYKIYKRDRVHQIALFLFKHIENHKINAIKDSGLFSGRFGVILFLGHYLHFFPCTKHQLIYNQYLDSCIHKLSEEEHTSTYCSGIIGILNCLSLMKDSSLIDIDYSAIEKNCYQYMLKSMRDNITHNNYDFMHGAIGIALYYKKDPFFTKEVIKELNNTAIKDRNTIKWTSRLDSKGSIGYNISLSHGISSIVIYLTEVYKNNIMREQVKELLYGALNYILSQEINYKRYGSFFPSRSIDNKEPTVKSRLAWCYGDLGIAIALWQAGKEIGNNEFCFKAMQIMKHCANRRDIEREMIRDAGICHGSAGVAMIFDYMYIKTNERLFLDAYNYWLSITIGFGTSVDGACGYKKYIPEEYKDFKTLMNEYELLEGVSGIGLVLLSQDTQRLSKDWKELFLLY